MENCPSTPEKKEKALLPATSTPTVDDNKENQNIVNCSDKNANIELIEHVEVPCVNPVAAAKDIVMDGIINNIVDNNKIYEGLSTANVTP